MPKITIQMQPTTHGSAVCYTTVGDLIKSTDTLVLVEFPPALSDAECELLSDEEDAAEYDRRFHQYVGRVWLAKTRVVKE